MRAEISFISDIARTVERADEISGFQRQRGHGWRATGVGFQITFTQFAGREQRRVARDIDQNIGV